MYVKAVWERGPGDGREPVITVGVLASQGGENWESGRGKTLHDVGAAGGAAALGFVVADEAGHVRHLARRGIGHAIELLGHVVEVVVGIGDEIAGGPRVGRGVDLVSEGIFVEGQRGRVESFNVVTGSLHEAKDMIKTPVFHHEDKEMFDLSGHYGVSVDARYGTNNACDLIDNRVPGKRDRSSRLSTTLRGESNYYSDR